MRAPAHLPRCPPPAVLHLHRQYVPWAANWVQIGAGQVSAGAAEDTRLALHPSSGARYVAYRDNANAGKCRWGGGVG